MCSCRVGRERRQGGGGELQFPAGHGYKYISYLSHILLRLVSSCFMCWIEEERGDEIDRAGSLSRCLRVCVLSLSVHFPFPSGGGVEIEMDRRLRPVEGRVGPRPAGRWR